MTNFFHNRGVEPNYRPKISLTAVEMFTGGIMKSHVANIGVALAIIGTLGVDAVFAQQAPVKRDFDAEIQAAIESAKTAAGFEFLGTLVRTCLLPQSGGEDTRDNVPGYITNPASAPARDTWYAEPAKVFDNLYFVGGKVQSSWALTTREGIILIDTIYPYNSEELIIGGMQKVGLDPKNIQYVLISHAHTDHIGGAEMLQNRYGARIVMGGPDWDMVEKYPNRYKPMAPKRDIVATDGMKIALGDTTVTIWLTPGHTPGTLSYTFTVLDRGKPVNVAYSGGTAFNFVNNTPDPGIKNFQTYIDSQKRMAAKAAATGATILLSNHSEFDNAFNKNRMLAGRGNGPHPYELGADWVQRYFQVMQGCARAAQLRLEQQLVETAKR
jgi:metallo-beta-lactamase class B